MKSIWAVRLVTAVEAVRRKRKAALRLWVGVGVEDAGIAVPRGGKGRVDYRYTFVWMIM